MNINSVYCGNSLDLIPQLDVIPNLTVLHPPDISETSYNKSEYITFLNDIYLGCWEKLDKNGMLVSINTDRKMEGIFAKHHEIMKIMEGKHLVNYKIWVKTLKTNFFIPTFAHCLFYAKGKTTNNKIKEFMPDVWVVPQEKVNGYPAKDNFPSKLIELVINNCSNAGDLVFDPFVGSGTTMIESKKLKRSFIGFDLSEEFVSLSRNLLSLIP